ncbi:hypothetical protein [Sporanaerobacter sp. PP17-6a]|uniref:hypothetical protein n=1 Tax=Sporanaerobacter sp. PP17-6a TaxID=1891289 RepID=UPI00089FE4BD|nr:hypothetical protein [Sporanaerobacter sp. PP17-6a]SCL84995.1 hypothetical protein PP176A_0774 [Sporanaerobacter sp. PP17-6a]
MKDKEVLSYLMDRYKKSNGKRKKMLYASILALRKRIPQKPKEQSEVLSIYNIYNCPCCEEGVGIYNIEREEWSYQNEYCPECGQHISWEGIDSE